MSVHLIRYTKQQAGFDTPTVGHFAVLAEDPLSAVASIERYYRGWPVKVEYITMFGC